ncbi:hypothetical protein BaRGS_00019111 [Batillaria attramentaria]|uniref:Uncharacterized protein n=1 Tax=Batillaria attramentaria TaxID=370345 RepID=A0ABD0KQZ5_9CAEN
MKQVTSFFANFRQTVVCQAVTVFSVKRHAVPDVSLIRHVTLSLGTARATRDGQEHSVGSVPRVGLIRTVCTPVVWDVATRVTETQGDARADKDGTLRIAQRVPLDTTITPCLESIHPGTVSRVAQGVVTRVTDSLDTVHVGQDGSRHFVITDVLLDVTVRTVGRRVPQAVTDLVTGLLAIVPVGHSGDSQASVPRVGLIRTVRTPVVWDVATRVTETQGDARADRDGTLRHAQRVPLDTTITPCLESIPPGTVSRVAQGVVTRVTDSLDTVHVCQDGNRHFVITNVQLATTHPAWVASRVALAISDDGGSNTGAIVGSVVGVGVVICITILVTGLLIRSRRLPQPTVEHSETPRNSAAEGHEAATECRADLEATNGEGIGEQGDVSHNYDTARSYENADDIRFYTSLETNQPSTHGPQSRRVPRPTFELGETQRNSVAEEEISATECRGDLEVTDELPSGGQGDGPHNYDKLASYENSDDIKPYTSLQTKQPSSHGPQDANTMTASYANVYVTTGNQYENI